MRSTIVSAGLLALTLLTSQAALARPIALEGNAESELALRNSDIIADGLEVEARSIDELFDQLEARAKTKARQRAGNAGAKKRAGGQAKQRGQTKQRSQNRNTGQKRQTRQRNQGQSRQRQRPSTLGRILRSPLTNNVVNTVAGGVAQRIANGGGGGAEPVDRREFEEYLEARTRPKPAPRKAAPISIGRTLNRALNSQTGQTIVTSLADGVAQRIANGP
ncbi:hypothetical protein MD484_g7756, partial [Candolleomyces efflorescens]